MSMEATIRAALAADVPLMALAQGVSVGELPQGVTLPWVTLNRIDTPRRHAFGPDNPVIRSKPRFQFDVWTDTGVSASIDAAAVMDVLIPAVCALPYAVELVTQHGRRDQATDYWHEQLDATVAHAGA